MGVVVAGEHITRADDPTLLPLARSKVASIRASGMKWGSQRFIVGSAIVTAQVKGHQSYISVEGYGGVNLIEMDSGIIDVGAVVITYLHGDRYLPGERRYIPTYEHVFNLRVGTTPWYIHLANTGQIAGVISLGSKIVGRVRKDEVTEAYSPRTYDAGLDENGDRLPRAVDTGDERLVAKKRAGVFCPPSMYSGKMRLFVQAMYGRPLYIRGKGGEADTPMPTPSATITGMPYLGLPAYAGNGSVTLDFNAGVYLDPASKKHWLMLPGVGYVTVIPLIADEMGERARYRLTQGKLNDEDALHLEAYILSSCRPDVDRAVTLNVTSIVNWASGYGWHWNWSGTQADMVRITGSDRVPFDNSMHSTHYRLTATATYDPNYDPAAPENTPGDPAYVAPPPGRIDDTTWEAAATTVSGPHLFMVQTPVFCVTHPNWTNRYVGEDLDHIPIFWSEKMMLNHDQNLGLDFAFSEVPLYAFYVKDALQLATLSLSIGDVVPAYLEATDRYVTMAPGGGPTDYTLVGASIGNDAAYLRVFNEVSKPYVYTLTCGSASVSVLRGSHVLNMTIEDSAKSVISGPGPIEGATFFGPGRIEFRSGRPLEDGGYTTEFIAGGLGAYFAGTQYSTCQFTSTEATFDKQWFGNCGGVIPFYDSEAFYLMQDTWSEEQNLGRRTRTMYGSYFGHDGGEVVADGMVVYYGWSTFEVLASATGFSDTVETPNDLTVVSEAKALHAITSCGNKQEAGAPGSMYLMFEDGDADYIGETFHTIGSAGSGGHFKGVVEMNWPSMPGMTNPVIVGWV